MSGPSLTFRYGTMGCGKSARLLIDLFSYDRNHLKAYLIKPAVDTRTTDTICSRIPGMSRIVDLVLQADTSMDTDTIIQSYRYVFVDEAQFLSAAQVQQLWHVSMSLPVVCYGLRTDFQGHLFPGSARLFELADHVEHIASLCAFCHEQALWNMRFVEKRPVFNGATICIGGDETYAAVCKHCASKNQVAAQEQKSTTLAR